MKNVFLLVFSHTVVARKNTFAKRGKVEFIVTTTRTSHRLTRATMRAADYKLEPEGWIGKCRATCDATSDGKCNVALPDWNVMRSLVVFGFDPDGFLSQS